MAPVGHSLVGLSIGVALCPDAFRGRPLVAGTAFVALSLLPDWPVPGWGHDEYLVSHSLWVNAALVAVVAAAAQRRLGVRATVAGGAAWLSHLLLDSFYNHGQGVIVGWPVNRWKLNLPIPWLHTLDLAQPLWSAHNLGEFALEAITFGPLLLVAAAAGRRPAPQSR